MSLKINQIIIIILVIFNQQESVIQNKENGKKEISSFRNLLNK
jgi:hypothetical protein